MSGNLETGDWDWSDRNSTGYTYPVDAHLFEPNTEPGRHRRRRRGPAAFKIAVTGAVTLIVGAVATAIILAPQDNSGAGAATSTTRLATPVSAQLPLTGSAGGWPGPYTAPTKLLPVTPDPYTDPGNWLVGTDIPPGRYTVLAVGEQGGYWARCSNEACEPGDGVHGLLDNRLLPRGARTTVDILATDYMVQTAGVRLMPQ